MEESLNQGSISEGIKGKGLQIMRPHTKELALIQIRSDQPLSRVQLFATP